MGGHTPISVTLPRGSPPPHSLQQLTILLWSVEEIVMVKIRPGHPILPQKAEKYPSLVKTSPMRQHQTILMLTQWQLHTVSLETRMSGHSINCKVSFSPLPEDGARLPVWWEDKKTVVHTKSHSLGGDCRSK